MIIAETLKSFPTLLPKGEAYKLLDPLWKIASIDETSVREQAVKTIKKLAEEGVLITDSQIVEGLVASINQSFSSVSATGSQFEWPVRVSGCQLFATVYKALKAVEPLSGLWISRREEFFNNFVEVFKSTDLMAKSAAVSVMGDVGELLEDAGRQKLLELYEQMMESDSMPCRAAAISSSPKLFGSTTPPAKTLELFYSAVNTSARSECPLQCGISQLSVMNE